MALEITDSNYKEILAEGKPVVIDFWAPWCGPCKMVGPIIEELAEMYEGQVLIGKCDVDENGDVAAEYGIRNIPTVLFFKNGELVDKQVGSASKSAFDDKIKKMLLKEHNINKVLTLKKLTIMGLEDDFLKDDLDDEKTIEYIKNYLPQELKEKFSDDEFYYFLDLIDEYYSESGILDVEPDEEGCVEVDLGQIVDYIIKEAHKDEMGDYDPEEILFVVQGELEYTESLDDDEE